MIGKKAWIGVLSVAISLSPAGAGFAQPLQQGDEDVAIFGRIFDAETGDPVPAAQVFLQSVRIGALTQLDGTYVLREVPDGTYVLTIAHDCYHTVRLDVEYSAAYWRSRRVDLGLPFKHKLEARQDAEPLGGCGTRWQGG